ncbi:hypothetical protein ON010_g14746 [Phytophthora cinnamomi]|nr:hypothetical protein ON010_g14746 [Phytophthora cinnamomi]
MEIDDAERGEPEEQIRALVDKTCAEMAIVLGIPHDEPPPSDGTEAIPALVDKTCAELIAALRDIGVSLDEKRPV